MKLLPPIAFVPGILFWALIIIGIVTENHDLFWAAGAIAALTIPVLLTLKIRASQARKAAHRRVRAEGRPAVAQIISLGTRGGSYNDEPYVDLELEVSLGDKPPYRTKVTALISKLAIPRIQPNCQIAVLVDPNDESHAGRRRRLDAVRVLRRRFRAGPCLRCSTRPASARCMHQRQRALPRIDCVTFDLPLAGEKGGWIT